MACVGVVPMTRKINAFVCDGCRVCTPAGADEYPETNGWEIRYWPDGSVTHWCPKCVERKESHDADKCL